jgi:hypothetical protein
MRVYQLKYAPGGFDPQSAERRTIPMGLRRYKGRQPVLSIRPVSVETMVSEKEAA